MEHYDSQMAARVWQRVQNTQEAGNLSGEILLLLAEETQDVWLYRQLSKTQSKENTAVLAKLLENSRQCVHMLRGIHYLLTGTYPETVRRSRIPSPAPLRGCYGSTLRRNARYSQWSSHSEYGPAFAQMAALNQQRCCLLLQLIGLQYNDK